MRLVALTGISKESIEEFVRRRIRTFEIRSANNIISISRLKLTDSVFLTDATPPDLVEGLCGVVGVVKGIDVRMHSIAYGGFGTLEERETMAARIQLVLESDGRVKSVLPIRVYEPVFVDVIEVKRCEAG